MPKRYPEEFRRKELDLVAAGRRSEPTFGAVLRPSTGVLQFEAVDVAATTGTRRGRGWACVGCTEAAGRSGALAPRIASGDQPFVVPFQDATDNVGEQFAVGLLGFNVHGAGPVVVGDDTAKVVRGCVFGPAT